MRISGVNIPDNKKVFAALSYLYGVGPALAVKILEIAKVDLHKRA